MSEEQLIATPGVFGENGNFLLERELGRGGMGGVYMGRDKMLDRPVAVKVMLPEYGSDEEFVGKFKKEAQAVARLIHPNIAQVYSYGISNGMPYIAMELVAGGSLDGLMKNQGKEIEVPRVMKICEQVAQALRCAADQGLVHGDVKPENILLDANGNAKLVDFGLAAMQKDTDEIWGTPYYIAPEKCKRQPVDYRADMYSLGGTIYHALTGQPPFEGDDANEVVRARFMGPPKKPSELRPGLSPQIDALVMTMLAVEPKDRYPSFEALLEEFKKVMTTGLSMTSPISPTAADGVGGTRKTTVKGGKKVMLKPKKGFKVKTGTTDDNGGDVPPTDDIPDVPAGEEPPKKIDDEDEEEGGNLGLKVLGVVGGVILAILLICGGLWWFVQHSKDVERQEQEAQMRGALGKAQASLKQTRQYALEHAESFEKLAAESLSDCENVTAEIRKLLAPRYSDNILAMLKPAEPADLIAARIELDKPLDAPAEAPEPEPAPAPAPTPAPAATDGAAAPAAPAADGAAAPAPAADGAAAPEAAPAAAPEAPAAAEEAPAQAAEEVPPVVKSVNELWTMVYGIQTRAYRIRREVNILVHDIDKALSVADMAQAVSLANSIADRYTEITGNPDTDKAQKDAGKIPSRCKSIKEKETRRLRQVALEEEKGAKKKQDRIDELTKTLNEKKESLEKAEAEIGDVKQCFATCADPSTGLIKYFDWAGMKRKLNALPLESPYAENQRKKELRKVDALELSQKVLMENMKGYTFTRAIRKGVPGIKGGTVASVDAKQIVVSVGGKKKNITWIAFYRDYRSNLDELIGKFIRGGRQNPKKRLTHLQWFNAMIGTAYTLSNVCADDETVTPFVEDKLLKEAVIEELKKRSDSDEESEETPAEPINEKDEDIKSLMEQIAEVNAKLNAIDVETRKVPFYRELFPNANYDAFKAAAAED